MLDTVEREINLSFPIYFTLQSFCDPFLVFGETLVYEMDNWK